MQRNPSSSSKKTNVFDGKPIRSGNNPYPGPSSGPSGRICSACKTQIPMVPGFRPSSLKCPKCGKAAG